MGITNDVASSQTLSLQVGDVCCALKCKDGDVYSKLKHLYINFITERSPDITVEIQGDGNGHGIDLDAALSETRFIHQDNSFRTTSNLIAGQYDLSRRSICITAEKSLADPDLEINHLNKLLALAYYSACKIKYNGNPPAMLVHACAVIREGKALVFAGPSEAGKTTIARLCGENDGEVINDEIFLITRPSHEGDPIKVQGAPIVSRLAPRKNKSAPLACILLLKKSQKTLVHPLSKVDAYLRFLRQIIAPAYIGQKDRKGIYSLMADFTNEIIRNIPIYELEFSLDADQLWKVIGTFEKGLGRAA